MKSGMDETMNKNVERLAWIKKLLADSMLECGGVPYIDKTKETVKMRHLLMYILSDYFDYSGSEVAKNLKVGKSVADKFIRQYADLIIEEDNAKIYTVFKLKVQRNRSKWGKIDRMIRDGWNVSFLDTDIRAYRGADEFKGRLCHVHCEIYGYP